MKKKTINKQKVKKLWGLEKLTFNKAAQQYMDWDEKMTQDLKNNPEAAAWYSKFNEEYFGNTLDKDWRKNLHMKETKYDIYNATNARNRDMYNKRFKYNEGDIGLEQIVSSETFTQFMNPEDALIESMDKAEAIQEFVDKALKAGTDKKFTKKLTRVVFDMED